MSAMSTLRVVLVVCVACGSKQPPPPSHRPEPVAVTPDAGVPELEPGPLPADVPDPVELLSTVATAYAETPSYVDRGDVRTVFSAEPTPRELTFTTAFERGGKFRFEYRKAPEQYVIWSDGTKTVSSWSVQPGVKPEKSLDFGLGVAAGVSGGTSIMIPRLLLPRDVPGKRLTDRRVRVAGLDRVEGRECWRLVVEELASTATSRTLEETIWIDRELHLVRRVFERSQIQSDGKTPAFEVSQTTRYWPVAAEPVDAKLLAAPQ